MTEHAAAPVRRKSGSASLAQRAQFASLIDVRSPAEFADDHIPGAISCPVLSDAERAEVGTLYKQVSPFAAKKLGAAYISRNIGEHLQARFLQQDKNWRPLIICWRGGLRSGAMTTVLRSVGWDACQLEGGYKGFRQHVLNELDTLPGRFRLHLLDGPTGSAKSRILQEIAARGGQVLDLEGLACHKGSVLGRLPTQPQPAQKWFETQIWHQLSQFDPAAPVFIEAESRKIGLLRLPAALFAQMQSAHSYRIDAPASARIAYLLRDYAYFTQTPQALKDALAGLHHLLGQECLDAWYAQIDQGRFSELTAELLVRHYDPLYRRARQRDYGEPAVTTMMSAQLEDTDITRLARDILQHAASFSPYGALHV